MAASDQESAEQVRQTIQVRNFSLALWHRIRVRALEHNRTASAELEDLVLQGLHAIQRNGSGGAS